MDSIPSDEVLQLSPEEMRALGHRVIDILVEHFETLRDKPVGHNAGRSTLDGRLRELLPERASDVEVVLDVDAIVGKAVRAGGKAEPGPKQDHGFMYGRSFEDLDGHVFEPMWMDVEAAMAAMGRQQTETV
jgi:predicted lactoylglutathione lyase